MIHTAAENPLLFFCLIIRKDYGILRRRLSRGEFETFLT